MKIQRVGRVDTPVVSDDGEEIPLRLGKTGEVIIGPAHGEFYESALRGTLYEAATAVAGVAPGTSLSTTAAFYLHNPLDSNTLLSLVTVSIGHISGTLGAGTFFLTTHTGKAVTNPTGTAIVPRQTISAGGLTTGVAKPLTTATVTTQIALRPICSMGAFAGAEAPHAVCKDRINGEIVIRPGFGVGVHAIAAAGTTPRVVIGMAWEEIPRVERLVRIY